MFCIGVQLFITPDCIYLYIRNYILGHIGYDAITNSRKTLPQGILSERPVRQTRLTWTSTLQTFHSCTGRPDVSQRPLVLIPMNNVSENKPSTPMTHVAYESKLRSVVRSSMPKILVGNRACGQARDTQAFSAGIKCRHCSLTMHNLQNIVHVL